MNTEEKKISKEESRLFLEQYMNASSPVGMEIEGQAIWANYLKPYVDKLDQDNYGTVYGIVRSKEQDGKKESQRYKVVIEAHCDEIAWQVTQIESNGIVRVARCGGSDAAIAPSKKVIIHTKDGGKVPGVFGYPAIHVRKTAEEKAPKAENLTIDCGYNTKKGLLEKFNIEPGDLVTFDEQFSVIGWHYTGKALDNKIGGYIIAQVAKKLKENNIVLPYDLYVVNAVQEEVGLLGAKNIAQKLKANVALVHDVCHATDGVPGMSKIKNCDIASGAGPTLEYASQNHKKLLNFIRGVAAKEKIPYQIEVGSQGNDTMGFFLANTVTAIIASPLKYMHTTCEMVHKKDVTLAIELFYHCLINMQPIDWSYHNFKETKETEKENDAVVA